MKKYNLNNFIKGWIIGDFTPNIINRKDFEIAVKYYNKGDYEKKHIHNFSEEITIIAQGEVLMNGIKYIEKDIIFLDKGDATDFTCLKDGTITIVIKIPSSPNDKIVLEN